MSDQHEQHEPEVVPVEVDQDHEVVEHDEPKPSEGEVGEAVEPVAEDQPVDIQAERYERACVDPVYAEQQAIVVDDDDKGEAWERVGQPPLYGDPDDLPVHGEDDSHDDGKEV